MPEPLATPPEPRPIQAEALWALEDTRAVGHRAGLVVLATGLGKTWLAAFDSQRPEFPRVLFIAHREEILRQARDAFRQVGPGAKLGYYTWAEKVADADVTFRGEREDLLEMAANLIDNACKYGRRQVVVRLTPCTGAGGLFEIVVEDDGPGLSEADLARAMARGSRLDEAAPGQGLGLSILKETVDLYAGKLVFERGELGGLRARLRLPATD